MLIDKKYFKNKYRIVKDGYAGYQVQIKRWWLPIWVECFEPGHISNTHSSIELAKKFMEQHRTKSHIVYIEP